jgi:phenylalanyl-tRNA synthetase beta chain
VSVEPAAGEPVTFRIPTFRVDLKREADLIEEVARLYGVDRIPATAPRGAIGANEFDATHDQHGEVRRIMTGLGMDEAQGQTLISEAAAGLVSDTAVALANPLSSDMNVLRPSLLPGLMDALRHNVSRNSYDVALFELGRVFSVAAFDRPSREKRTNQPPPLCEQRRLAIALTGNRHPLFWTGEDRESKYDLYDLKGLLEEFLEQFGLRGVNYVRRSEPSALFVESATIHLGKFQIGAFGQLQPALARQYDLRDAVLAGEVDLDLLITRRNSSKSFKLLPAFPSIRRDVAMLVPESTTHEAVLQAVRQAKPANLESVELFDVFRGKNVPPGQKSMAYAFTYRNMERTLTDTEANEAHTKVVQELKQKLQATVRE